jgi:hypothetical protein
VLLDVGPRMHPHVEYASRAVSDFLMSKVGQGWGGGSVNGRGGAWARL